MKWRITGKTTGGFTLQSAVFRFAPPSAFSGVSGKQGPKHPAILPHDGPSVDPRYRPIRLAGFSRLATFPMRLESLIVERSTLHKKAGGPQRPAG
ncbi:hypothetical protein [Ensifer adhaerens]|uniref:hypothetical protein n=1 Tax=Ensifer adhaerens TaxID=106592 RepID=UPI000FDA179C|nr:hypothetical protein [Ensifer adhaerens]MDF8352799.1 hypothetical protein [Ensifer adhaerens]THA65891.1 hypothetical protein E5176_13120 [Ensifer adhaerens]